MSSVTKSNAPGTGPTSPSAPASAKSNRSDYWSGRPGQGDPDPTNKDSPDYDRALDPSVSDDDLTDPEYLRRQGERAKAAIMGAAGAIKASAVGGAKGLVSGFKGPDADGSASGASGDGSADGGIKGKAMGMVQEHPWYTLGGATAAGFLAAIYLNPSRFGRLRKRIKHLEERLEKQERVAKAGGPHAVATQEAAKSKATKTSLWTSLGTMAMGEAMRSLKPFLTHRIAPLMAGLGGAGHPGAGGGYGHPEEISPEVMAALRERFGGHVPPDFGMGGMPPGFGGGASGQGFSGGQTHGGGMPPGAGGQVPPRSAGDPSI